LNTVYIRGRSCRLIFNGNPQTYFNWASEYFEEKFKSNDHSLKTITEIYEGKNTYKETVLTLVYNLEDWKQLEKE